MLIFFIIIFRVESDDDDSETFVNGSESQDHSETASFYLGDKHTPVYARLLLDPPEDKVASKPPVKCQENKIFIIDKKSPYFRNPDDWKADGLGVYKNDGTRVVAYNKDKNPEIRWISKTKPEDCKRSAPQFFSRERTGRTYNILISAEELMKYSDIVGTALRPSDSYFYSTVSAENHMRSRPNHTAILSPRKLLLAPNLEFWRASRER